MVYAKSKNRRNSYQCPLVMTNKHFDFAQIFNNYYMQTENQGPYKVMFISENMQIVESFSQIIKHRDPDNKIIKLEHVNDILKKLNNENNSKPNIIIIDIQPGNKDAIDAIRDIKNNKRLKYIPVIIIKQEREEDSIFQFYASHVNCFILKPNDSGKLFEVLKAIDEFWLEVVKLPKCQEVLFN